MKAAVLYGKEDVRVEEITPAPLKMGEVRIRIEAALTCGTDLKVFKRGYHTKMIVPPAVFGHELAGVICEVRGANCEVRSPESEVQRSTSKVRRSEFKDQAQEWRVGDRRVVANFTPCCG